MGKYSKFILILKNIIKGNVFKNILWLALDKSFKLFLGLFVGIWLARFLGPVEWGRLNYLQAYITILAAIATLGLDSFFVKEILENPNIKYRLIGTAFLLRFVFVIISLLAVIYYFIHSGETSENLIIFCFLAIPILFSPFDIIDIEYQSLLQSRKTVLAKNIAYLIGGCFKIYFILIKMNLIYFAAVIGLESFLASTILLTQYQIKNQKLKEWGFDFRISLGILVKAWPFIISSLSIILYMRVDQIMIGKMINNNEVGQFSAAVKITELFLFIPMIISSSFFPLLVNSRKDAVGESYKKSIKLFFQIMAIIPLGIVLFVSFFSNNIVHILYGIKYPLASQILIFHIWALVPIFMGVAANQYLVLENLQIYTFIQTVFGLVANVVANFILIPKLGGVGAAIATLISQYIVGFISHMFFKKTRFIVKTQFTAFVSLFTFRFIKDFKSILLLDLNKLNIVNKK